MKSSQRTKKSIRMATTVAVAALLAVAIISSAAGKNASRSGAQTVTLTIATAGPNTGTAIRPSAKWSGAPFFAWV